jgi:hypothetical protein
VGIAVTIPSSKCPQPNIQGKIMNIASINHFMTTSSPRMGVERMERNLVNFIDRLISNYAKEESGVLYLNISDLDDHAREEFTAYLLEDDERDLYSIYENKKYDDIVSKLICMLKDDSLDTRNDFAESVRNNMVSYYSSKMQQLIDEQIPVWLEGRRQFFGEAA